MKNKHLSPNRGYALSSVISTGAKRNGEISDRDFSTTLEMTAFSQNTKYHILNTFSDWFEYNRNRILFFSIPFALLFTTGENQFIFRAIFYMAPLPLSLLLLTRKQESKQVTEPQSDKVTKLTSPFYLLITLFLFMIAFQFLGGFFGASLGRTVIAAVTNLTILAWMILTNRFVQQENIMAKWLYGDMVKSSNLEKSTSSNSTIQQFNNPQTNTQCKILNAKYSILHFLSDSLITLGIILSLISWYFLIPGVPKPGTDTNLVYAVAGHNRLDGFLLMLFPLLLWRWLHKPSRFNVGLMIFFFISLLSTFGRTSFLTLSLLGIWATPALQLSRNAKRFIFFMSLILLVCALSIIGFASTPFADKIAQQPHYFQHWLWRQTVKPINTDGRLDYWQAAWQGFQLRPLLGNGAGTYELTYLRFRQSPGSESSDPANLWALKLSEEGLVGTLMYLLIWVCIGVMLWRLWQMTGAQFTLSRAFVATVGAGFLHAHLDVGISMLQLKPLYWILVAVLFAYYDFFVRIKT